MVGKCWLAIGPGGVCCFLCAFHFFPWRNRFGGRRKDEFLGSSLLIACFVISFAQALLEYFSSSEARNKCTYQAIGGSAKLVKFGWQWRFWKMRVQYPLLDLSSRSVLDLAFKSVSRTINFEESPVVEIVRKHDWTFYPIRERDDSNYFTMS